MTKENEIRLAKLETEAGTLDLKLAKLDQFLFEHKYKYDINPEEIRLMKAQRTIMFSYSTVLHERVEVLRKEINKPRINADDVMLNS